MTTLVDSGHFFVSSTEWNPVFFFQEEPYVTQAPRYSELLPPRRQPADIFLGQNDCNLLLH